MAQVPVQLGAGVGQQAGVGAGHGLAGGAAVLEMPARLFRHAVGHVGGFGQVNGEVADVIQEAEEDPFGFGWQGSQNGRAEPAQLGRRLIGQQHVQVAEGQEPAGRIRGLLKYPVLVAAFGLAAIDGVIGKDMGWVGHLMVHLVSWRRFGGRFADYRSIRREAAR